VSLRVSTTCVCTQRTNCKEGLEQYCVLFVKAYKSNKAHISHDLQRITATILSAASQNFLTILRSASRGLSQARELDWSRKVLIEPV